MKFGSKVSTLVIRRVATLVIRRPFGWVGDPELIPQRCTQKSWEQICNKYLIEHLRDIEKFVEAHRDLRVLGIQTDYKDLVRDEPYDGITGEWWSAVTYEDADSSS